MIAFLTANLATILISALLLCVVAWIVVARIKRKKSGKLGCGCAHCPNAAACQEK